MLDLVSWFSDEGETVIDPFAGAGTTGLACKLLGRDHFGCEVDPGWAERARRRLTEPLSERDQERYVRHLRAREAEAEHKSRMAGHTARIRARLEAAKAAR